LADSCVAFLAGARLAGLFTGARRTALLADRFAVFLAGARFAAVMAGERLTIFAVGCLAVVVAGALPTVFLVDVFADFLRIFVPLDVLCGADNADLPFTTLFSVLLAENRTDLEAAIFTGAPVCGLRPTRAPRCVGLKLPNPTTDTRRPARNSLTTLYSNALTASSESRFVNVVVLLIASIRPDLFTRCPPPYSGISSIKEGFCVKVKHLRCWSKVTREVTSKIARRQTCCNRMPTRCNGKERQARMDRKPFVCKDFFHADASRRNVRRHRHRCRTR
jgi:putative acetyltransferase